MATSSNARTANAAEIPLTTAVGGAVEYDEQITKYFLTAAIIFGVVGMLVGVIIALAARVVAGQPRASRGLTFGRLRPLHTNAVIFAFGGNICFTGIYYSMQRLLKTRMWSDTLSPASTSGAGSSIIVSAALTLPARPDAVARSTRS